MSELSSSTSEAPAGRRLIASPHPEWGPDDLVARATELVPVLRDRGERCAAEGRLLEETNDEFVEAGFYRVLQPRAFGGYEFGIPGFARLAMEVARGCPSSGWVLALTAGHALMLSAFFTEEAQVQAYGTDGDFRAPSIPGPRGVTAAPVDGGYLVNGFWDYASGIDVSTHFLGGFKVLPEGPDGPPGDTKVALFTRDQYEIENNWRVFGMQGTGSRRTVVKDAFVPESLAISPPRDAFNAQNAPGRSVHTNPMYCAGRLASLLLEEMAAVAVGVAKGMLDVVVQEVAGKAQMWVPGSTQAESPLFQRHYGEAWALIAMAEATVLRVAEQYMEYARQDAEEGVTFSDEKDQQLQVLEQYATKLCAEAVDRLFRTSGTSSAQEGALRQRYFRDMSVINTHAAAQYERGAEALGRIHLTGKSAPTP